MARFENSKQRDQREGRESRASVVAFLADAITNPSNPLTTEQLNELCSVQLYFPDLNAPIDDVLRRYADRPDLRDAILLAAAVRILELLIDPAPAEPKLKAKSATEQLASRLAKVPGKGAAAKVRRVVPE